MATITPSGVAPGRGGMSPLFARGGQRLSVLFGTMDFDSSYPTGGESISDIFDQFKLESGNTNVYIFFSPAGGYVFGVDYSAKKVLVYNGSVAGHTHDVVTSDHTHAVAVTDGTAGNAVTFNTDHLEATGGGTITPASDGGETVTSDAVAAAGGPAEVANATNLSTLTGVRWMAVGVAG